MQSLQILILQTKIQTNYSSEKSSESKTKEKKINIIISNLIIEDCLDVIDYM